MAISLKDSYNLSMGKLLLLAAIWIALLPSPARAGFGGHVGSHLGIGNMGGGRQPVSSKSMGTLDLQAMPGYSLFGGALMPGIMAQLRFLSQLAGSTSYGEEVSGTGFLLGLGVAYKFDLFKVIASWDLRARHSYDNPGSTFKGSGFTLQFGYKTMADLYMDFLFSRTSYSSREVMDVEQIFPVPVAHWNLGLGISYSF